MVLTGIKLGIVWMFRVQNLQLCHRSVSRVTRSICSNCQAVVSGRWNLEFQSNDEVCVLVCRMQNPAVPSLATNRSVNDFVVVDSTGPACQIRSVEPGLETISVAFSQNLVRFFAGISRI